MKFAKIENNQLITYDNNNDIWTIEPAKYDGKIIPANLNMVDDLKLPDLPEPSFSIRLTKTDLAGIEPFIGKEEVRYYLNGIYLCKKGLIATNGRIMITHDKLMDIESGVIIPRQMVKLMKDGGLLEICGDYARFNGNIIGKLVDGNYPDYERVIPQENELTIMVDKKALLNALKEVKPFLEDKRVEFDLKNGKLNDFIELPLIQNADLTIGFDWQHVKNMALACTDNIIKWSFKDILSPSMVECTSRKIILMPLRV